MPASTRSHPSAERPLRWLVLLVALSLLAVVAALATTQPAASHLDGAPSGAATGGTDGLATLGDLAPGEPRRAVGRYAGVLYSVTSSVAVYRQWAEGGTELAAVELPTSTRVELGLACPGGRSSGAGRAEVELRVPAGVGSCTVTLSEVSSPAAVVPYRLTVERLRR